MRTEKIDPTAPKKYPIKLTKVKVSGTDTNVIFMTDFSLPNDIKKPEEITLILSGTATKTPSAKTTLICGKSAPNKSFPQKYINAENDKIAR